jgi:hypothetical protein
MGIPLDSVQTGHWLICSRGPVTRKTTMIGETYETTNHECEGVLMRVLAVSAPFVFLRVYPIPAEDGTTHPPFNSTIKWADVEFTRPSRGYLRLYLRLSRQKAERTTQASVWGRKKKSTTLLDPFSRPGP